MKMALKWGIVSAGSIAHDFVNALGTLNKDDHHVVAVAAQDLDRAQKFAQRFDIPKAYDNYLKLAQDSNVEIVYIGNLITQHLEVAQLMLDHGKHVLVEKPMCLNETQARELVSYAKKKNLFLMEAIWSRFFPSYQYIRKQIASGKLGEIISVDASFCDGTLSNLDRLTKKSLGGSVTTDLGVYPIHLSQWVFQQEPTLIKATGTLNDGGVDVEMSANLHYGNNQVARVRSSVINTRPHEATIVGTKGTIKIPAPCRCPETIIDVDGTEKTWKLPEAKFSFNWINSCGLRYEADEVRKCIRAGKTECEYVTHNDSIIFSRIQDKIRKQVGAYSENER